MTPPEERLETRARELGLGWFGIARAEELERDRAGLERWLAEGRHGQMEWLGREPERRSDPRRVLEGCRSVVMVGLNYLREDLPGDSEHPLPGHGRISRYARTRDYHRVLEKLLKKLARFLEEEVAPGAACRYMVDYGPVLERPWAARAGIGFIGKHTLLIHPEEGSFHFLGTLLTTAGLAPSPQRVPERVGCGDCRRCLDICPTGAIDEPFRLDARRCLSYLTIEARGATSMEHHARHEGWVFGCDLCQEVCPYNRSRARTVGESPLGPLLTGPQVPLARLIRDPEGWLAQFEGVAVTFRRTGPEGLARNAVIVARTLGDHETLAALKELAGREDRPEWLRELARQSIAELEPRLHRG